MKLKLHSNIFKKVAATFAMFLLSLGLSAQTNVFDDVIATSPNHTYLEAALIQQGLDANLRSASATLTVFAPDDNAFTSLATSLGTNIQGLLALPNLTDILLYHVLGTSVNSSAITNGLVVSPLSPTNTLKLTLTTAGNVFVNQAQVSTANLTASNGIVHVLNSVLLPKETVADVAIDNGFTTLVAAVVKAELLPALTNPLATLTVFAPTDSSFAVLATALGTTVSGLLTLPNLQDILLYHVLGTSVNSSAITNGLVVSPLSPTNTLKLTLTTTGNVFVNQARVTTANVPSDNGIVHILNSVLLPKETVADVAIDNGFTTLVAAVVKAELLPALTNPLATLTVFAPTDSSFAVLATALGTTVPALLNLPNLKDVLLYHVLGTSVNSSAITNGLVVSPLSPTNTLKLTLTTTGNVFVNQARVTTANVPSDNGIVHILNSVLLPKETVADVAIDNGFTTLVAAVVKAELLPALTNPLATLTVFAPTDSAFAALAITLGTTVPGLLNLPNLQDILLYHVLGTTVVSSALVNGSVATLNGQNLTINLTNGVKVNTSNVTLANLIVDNGVVHVIDAVLVPSTVGVKELRSMNIQISPNPTTDFIKLANSNSNEFVIYNSLGSIVKSGKVTNNMLDVSSLAEGNYFLRLTSNDGIYQAKFIKL